MTVPALTVLKNKVSSIARSQAMGRVHSVDGHLVRVSGLEDHVTIGDRLRLFRNAHSPLDGEVIRIDPEFVTMLPDKSADKVGLTDRVISLGPTFVAPCASWLGRVIDAYGQAIDHRPLAKGDVEFDVNCDPPAPMSRAPLGARLDTGFHVFNTILPLVTGQRTGIFAGSGVGKSMLLGELVASMDVDVVVLALIGERGREIRHFIDSVLGDAGMVRTVVVAASSDTPPTERYRCPLTAMRVAEYFRDQGKHVLLIADSITRFAEAHRELAIAAGEFPGLRSYPASTPSRITKLIERAGPGRIDQGNITAIFSVLVAGSDFDEPVADMMRGILDGHIILTRDRAERGQFPAVDVLASVSRSLPDTASDKENALISRARRLETLYDSSAALISAGLYTTGTNPELDRAIEFHGKLETFISGRTKDPCPASFEKLALLLRQSETAH